MTDNERAEIIQFLEDHKSPKFYKPGQIIFSQGEPADKIFYMKQGLGHVYTIIEDGSDRNIMIVWPGRFFGTSTFFNDQCRQSAAIVLKDSEVLCIERQLYQQCSERFPEFREMLLLELSKDLVVMFEQLADSSMFDSDINVARFICRRLATARQGEREALPVIEYTQELIATMIGLSRWSVNRALSSFKEKGWVQVDRGKIKVLKADEIRKFAYDRG